MHLSEMAGAILYPKTESLDIMGDYPLNGNVSGHDIDIEPGNVKYINIFD